MKAGSIDHAIRFILPNNRIDPTQYVHPATHTWPEAFPPDYDFAGEFAALVDPRVAETVRTSGIRRVTFGELAAAHG